MKSQLSTVVKFVQKERVFEHFFGFTHGCADLTVAAFNETCSL